MSVIHMSLQEWKEKEIKRLDKERKKRTDDAGYAPILRLSEGTTTLQLQPEIPRIGKYGKMFTVKAADNVTYDLKANENSPLYRSLIEKMDPDGPVTIKITRIGTGRTDTRYKVD